MENTGCQIDVKARPEFNTASASKQNFLKRRRQERMSSRVHLGDALREALLALRELPDSEQETLDSWFSGAMRNPLRTAGISDEEIGPERAFVDYWAGDFVEERVPAGLEAPLTLLRAVRALRVLSDEELDAIANWFRFEDRSLLWKLGAGDEVIGPVRSVPDNETST
jgi:hypothetical protein